MDFSSFHPYLGELASDMEDDIDTLAERIRFAGEVAPGSLMEFLADSGIEDVSSEKRDTCTVAQMISADLEILINAYKKAISVTENECKVTSNVLQEIADKRMRMKYFIDSTLECGAKEDALVIKVKS